MATSRSPLSPERIDAVALALVDEGGLAALSMRKLGAALGVDPMAIYHHVPNKRELFHRLVRHVFAAMPVPDPDAPWDDRVRAWAEAYRAVVVAHPALVSTVITDQAAVEVATAAATTALTEALLDAGLGGDDVVVGTDVIVDYVNGAVLACAPAPDGTRPDPQVRAHLAAAFSAGLEVVVDGLRARLP